MKRYKVYCGLITSYILVATTLFLTRNGVVLNAFNSAKRSVVSNPEYKLVLNVDNQATTAEVGSWNNPGSETNVGTRYTQLGNPIQIAFASGNGITRNGDATFCQMPGSYSGWFTNTTPLRGITSIKITVLDKGSQFVVDSSASILLNSYSYDAGSVPSDVTRSSTYTGSTSYTIDFNGEYDYFRIQNVGSSALRPSSCEITYNCYSQHEHNNSIDYIEHEATPAFRGVDGNIAYKECSICHKLFDMEGNEITQAQTVAKSNFFQVDAADSSGAEKNFDFTAADNAIITLDVYQESPSTGMRIFFGCSSPWTRTVCAFIKGDTFSYNQPISGKSNDGVTYLGQTTDGYYRYEFDLSKMPKQDGFNGVTRIGIYKWERSAGYLDVNTTGGTLIRGTAFSPANDVTIDYSTPYSLAGLTINLDVLFTSGNDTKMYLCFGDGWDDKFGYFSLYPTTKTGDINGLTVSSLEGGYIRFSFHIDNVTVITGSPEKINLFYMWKKYNSASGYVDVSFDNNNLVHHNAVTPFRGVDGNAEYYTCSVCGKHFDSTKAVTTAASVERESAFYEINNTTLPKKGSSIIYNIPEYKQLNFGDTFVIDFKLEQIGENSEIGFLIGDSASNYFGKFWVDSRANEYPRLQNSYGSGITSTFTTDGYLRVSVELDTAKINSGRQNGASEITKFDYVEILPGTDYVTCTCSVEILPEAGITTDGVQFIAGKDRTIDFPSSSYLKKSTGIIIVDLIIFGNDTKAAVMVGNWNNGGTYNGYYDLKATTVTGSYAGITVSDLGNGYKRFIFDLSLLNKGDIVDDTEDYKLLYIRGNWTTASGFIKITLLSKLGSPAMEDIY